MLRNEENNHPYICILFTNTKTTQNAVLLFFTSDKLLNLMKQNWVHLSWHDMDAHLCYRMVRSIIYSVRTFIDKIARQADHEKSCYWQYECSNQLQPEPKPFVCCIVVEVHAQTFIYSV